MKRGAAGDDVAARGKEIRFSLAHLTVLGCAPPELTYIAARAGYDFVSPRVIMMGVAGEQHSYDLAKDAALLRQTKTALASTGLRVHDIELARIHSEVDVRSYRPELEIGAELGAHHLICSIWTPDRGLALERFMELCEISKPLGLTVNLEFVAWANLSTLQEAIKFLRTANCENAGLLVDTFHFHCSGASLGELDTVPWEWAKFVHLCDAPRQIPPTRNELIEVGRSRRLYVGEGGIDVAGILNRLNEVLYSIEIPHAERSKELGNAEYARRCLETAKEYISKHEQVAIESKRPHGGGASSKPH